MNNGPEQPRVLLLMTPTTYRAADFLGAARAAGVAIVVGTNRAQTLAGLAPEHNLTLPFDDPGRAGRLARAYARRFPVRAVLGVDDEAVLPAAHVAAALDLPHPPAAVVGATRSKIAMREALAAAGLPVPPFLSGDRLPDPEEVARRVGFPCVVKPASLAGSRGVVRVDRPADLPAAWSGVRAVIDAALAEDRQGMTDHRILVERFLPGREVALEGLLEGGELRALALFDKPDPMDGPTFAETLFVTPSRHEPALRRAVLQAAAAAADAIGLRAGPLHAEFRLDGGQAHVLELAARTIGGLCARTLRFGTGMSLEEIVLRQACGLEIPSLTRSGQAAGVYMIPVPAAGTLRAVTGVDAAEKLAGIVEVTLTVPVGSVVRPLPEESRPLGFIFARGHEPGAVESSLRAARAALVFHIEAATA